MQTADNNYLSNARKVFQEQYIPFVQGVARNIRLEFVNAENNEQTAGVVATYDMDMFYLPPLFVGNKILRIEMRTECFFQF